MVLMVDYYCGLKISCLTIYKQSKLANTDHHSLMSYAVFNKGVF